MTFSKAAKILALPSLVVGILVANVGWPTAGVPVPHASKPAPAMAEAPAALPPPAPIEAATPGRVEELQARLAAESQARQRAEEEAAALRARLAPLEDNVVVSLGKVEDIGKKAGSILPALRELRRLLKKDRDDLSPREKKRLLELQRQNADVLGMLPEIAGFQDNPAEYGKFFRSMVQEAAGLDAAQADSVEAYMRERATLMNQAGLNTAKGPTDAAARDRWETRRDAFNQQSAAGLAAVLPPGAAARAGVNPQMMELLEMDFDKAEEEPAAKR